MRGLSIVQIDSCALVSPDAAPSCWAVCPYRFLGQGHSQLKIYAEQYNGIHCRSCRPVRNFKRIEGCYNRSIARGSLPRDMLGTIGIVNISDRTSPKSSTVDYASTSRTRAYHKEKWPRGRYISDRPPAIYSLCGSVKPEGCPTAPPTRSYHSRNSCLTMEWKHPSHPRPGCASHRGVTRPRPDCPVPPTAT